MKNLFSWFGQSIVLGSLLAGNVAVGVAIAAPDPAFRPILRELKQKTPSGWTMGLPSRLSFYGAQRERLRIYPDVSVDEGELFVVFSTQPGCIALACKSGAYIAASTIGSSGRDPYGNLKGSEEILLNSGIRGKYSPECASPNPIK